MPTVFTLASAAVESAIPAVVLGTALVILVAVAFRICAPVNAATRALVWLATLAALPLIQGVYFASHLIPTAPVQRNSLVIVQPASTRPSILPERIHPVALLPAATRASVALSIPTPPNFLVAALALYAALLSLLLARLLISYLRLCLLRRRTQPAPAELADRLDYWLARCPTRRRVALRLSNSVRSPLAVGWLRPVIVMPAALLLELSQQEIDHLGVHELAHIARYDDWTNLLQRILQAFLFFHPASYYVARRLNLEREIACDDWVVSAQESKSYARCLAKVVELRRYQRGSLVLSSGAFFGKAQLLKRVEALLDKTRNSATRVSSLTVLAAVVILAAIATQVVHLPAVIALTREQTNSTHIRWSDGIRDFHIEFRGDISFSPDEQSVASISPNGFMSIEQSKGWSHRRIEIRPSPTGTPEERYFLDDHEKPIDGVGRAWAAGAYLFVLREVGLDSDGRVGRILARRGVTGVLEEVDLIHSDQVKRDYLNHLLEQATLTNAELQRMTDSVRKISSDNDKADFLLAHQRDFSTDGLRNGFFRAINSINSDGDRRRVLTGILQSDGQSPETARLVGLSAKAMGSDNDKAEVLLAIPKAASGDNHCAILSAARTIQSDNEKARVLRESGYADSAQCRNDYFAVVNLIQSDGDRAGVLENLLTQPDLDAETYRDIAASAKAISSDNNKADVLVPLSSRYNEVPFFAAVNSIQSNGDRTRVLNAVLENTSTKTVLLDVIDSASTLSGDSEKTDVLLGVAQRSNDPEVRNALQQACQKIGSDNEYRRVASALFEGSKSVQSSRGASASSPVANR